MARAVVAGIVGLCVALGVALAGCGGSASPFGAAPACPLLAELAQSGQKVASADVSDPDAFDTTLREAIASYVRTARKLRDAVPERLQGDVDRMIAAAEQHRFDDASIARARVDAYARSLCNSSKAST